MPRDERAYLADVIESCEAIEAAVTGLDLAGYSASRLVRSSVEREFIIIGEAVAALSRAAPAAFGTISNARRIIDFRNQLTHEYPTVDDALVWAIVGKDVPLLKVTCVRLLENAGKEEKR
jgi:uncharacterized protein with HEPN domain